MSKMLLLGLLLSSFDNVVIESEEISLGRKVALTFDRNSDV